MNRILVILCISCLALGACGGAGESSETVAQKPEEGPAAAVETDRKPNIVFIVTDDQGNGDIGHHGNPAIATPNMDQLAGESVRFTNFHVDPTCSPTRSALMTGRYSMAAGVWHTIMGRSLMPAEQVTLPEILKKEGYRTAIFGKWHLGDNFPFRPQDQGFDDVLIHGGGGVGQTPDYWGNNQYDDTYYRNGEPEYLEGYATRIWFDQAIEFIRTNKDRPFFAYIATNAPHVPSIGKTNAILPASRIY